MCAEADNSSYFEGKATLYASSRFYTLHAAYVFKVLLVLCLSLALSPMLRWLKLNDAVPVRCSARMSRTEILVFLCGFSLLIHLVISCLYNWLGWDAEMDQSEIFYLYTR